MTPAFSSWYSGRSQRERRLILSMLAIGIPLLAWLLVVMPLSQAYENALERHLQAVDRNGRVRALAGVGRTSRNGAPEGDLALLVTDAAGRAGVTLDSSAPAGQDAVTVAVAQAPSTAVSQWLREVELQGLGIDELRIVPAGPTGVTVSARISKPSR